MTSWILILDGTLAALAVLCARRRPRHAPFAAWLICGALAGYVRNRYAWPYAVEVALYLLPPCSLGALVLHSLGRVSILPAVAWWALLSVLGFVVRDPAPLYLAAYCGAVGLGVASELARPTPPLDVTTVSVTGCIAWATSDIFGAQAYGDPWHDHPLTEKIALAFLLALCIAHVVHLWTRRRGF